MPFSSAAAIPLIEANGLSIPAIGLGTMNLEGDVCLDAVEYAIKCGYRHIDTARRYSNEKECGQAIRASGVARENLFVTTKVLHGTEWDNPSVNTANGLCRFVADPLATSHHTDQRHDGGSGCSQTQRLCAPYRHFQFHIGNGR